MKKSLHGKRFFPFCPTFPVPTRTNRPIVVPYISRAWRDTASSLAACLRRLRALVGGVDPSSRVTAAGLWELWEGVKDAVMRRCHLDEVIVIYVHRAYRVCIPIHSKNYRWSLDMDLATSVLKHPKNSSQKGHLFFHPSYFSPLLGFSFLPKIVFELFISPFCPYFLS